MLQVQRVARDGYGSNVTVRADPTAN